MRVATCLRRPRRHAGRTFSHDQGRKKLAETSGNVETSHSGSVQAGPEARARIEEHAREGIKVDFTTIYGWMDPTLDVPTGYSGTLFMHCSGFKRASNGAVEGKRDLWAVASPVTLATADVPPSFLLHGTRDTTVPFKQAELLHAALRENTGARPGRR